MRRSKWDWPNSCAVTSSIQSHGCYPKITKYVLQNLGPDIIFATNRLHNRVPMPIYSRESNNETDLCCAHFHLAPNEYHQSSVN